MILLFGIGCALLSACASSPTPTERHYVSGSLPLRDSLSADLIKEVNAYRHAKGKSKLSPHAGLAQLAQQHCRSLGSKRHRLSGANRVHHHGFGDRSREAIRRYQLTGIAENVAAGSWPADQAARQLVIAWQQSPSHDRNLRGDWRYMGVDVLIAEDGVVYATQLFAK